MPKAQAEEIRVLFLNPERRRGERERESSRRRRRRRLEV